VVSGRSLCRFRSPHILSSMHRLPRVLDLIIVLGIVFTCKLGMGASYLFICMIFKSRWEANSLMQKWVFQISWVLASICLEERIFLIDLRSAFRKISAF